MLLWLSVSKQIKRWHSVSCRQRAAEPGKHVGRIGLRARTETLGRELLGDGDRAGRSIERLEGRLGCICLDLLLAQAVECHLGFGQRASENRGTLDAVTARDADRLRRASNPPAALEVRKAHLLLQDVALQLGDLTGKQRTGRQ